MIINSILQRLNKYDASKYLFLTVNMYDGALIWNQLLVVEIYKFGYWYVWAYLTAMYEAHIGLCTNTDIYKCMCNINHWTEQCLAHRPSILKDEIKIEFINWSVLNVAITSAPLNILKSVIDRSTQKPESNQNSPNPRCHTHRQSVTPNARTNHPQPSDPFSPPPNWTKFLFCSIAYGLFQ